MRMRNSRTYGRLAGLVIVTAFAALVLVLIPALTPALILNGQVRTPAKPGRAILYAAAGPELMQFDVDVESASLVKRGSVTLPDNVQEARPDPSGKFLYVTWSNGVTGSKVPPGQKSPHGVSAFRIDPATGALHSHGDPISLAARSVFITTDMDGTHLE